MSTMTLEQVYNEMRENASEWRDCGYYLQADGLLAWADAIDAHLREREQSSIRGKYKGSFSTVDEFLADRKKEDKA